MNIYLVLTKIVNNAHDINTVYGLETNEITND